MAEDGTTIHINKNNHTKYRAGTSLHQYEEVEVIINTIRQLCQLTFEHNRMVAIELERQGNNTTQ